MAHIRKMASNRRLLLVNHYLPLLIIFALLSVSFGLTIRAITQKSNWVQQDIEVKYAGHASFNATQLNIGVWSWCVSDFPSTVTPLVFPGQEGATCIEIDICNYISDINCTLLTVGKGLAIASASTLTLALIATVVLLLFLIPTIALPLLVFCTIATFIVEVALGVFFRILRSLVEPEVRDAVHQIAAGIRDVEDVGKVAASISGSAAESRFRPAYGLMIASSVIVGLAMILSIWKAWSDTCGRRTRKKWSAWKGVTPATLSVDTNEAMHSEMKSDGTLV
ncbi:hypothetical protein BC832DRAFT_311260 [Gaertneriomyces semiglobifer]|nr:hypothetical protein BC832DRAFT_311260 [Gaertneriomyces semiglobifer]